MAVTIDHLVSQARASAGDRQRAAGFWQQVLARAPDHAEALNALANLHLAQGRPDAALPLLSRALEVDPHQPALLFNIASAEAGMGRIVAALQALDAALAVDPYFVQALFHKAGLLEQLDRKVEAAASYRAYLACMPSAARGDPRLATTIARAEAAIEADNSALRAMMAATVAADASPRMVETMRILTGEAKVYQQLPTFLTVPQLPAVPFFDRRLFPWLDQLEAGTADVISELHALLRDAVEPGFEPYVARPAGAPVNQWAELNYSRRWSAYHLWLDGRRHDENCARCPRTAALVESLPRINIPGRTPNAFFSVLRAGARIPPHTGVTNARATIHLGLIVPPGCGFRVGNDIRSWEPGKAWAFDDSIEHEAWNEGDHDRVILIIDSWNPFIEPSEKDDLVALHAAYDRHHGGATRWD